mgnify:CR=1 FL=1
MEKFEELEIKLKKLKPKSIDNDLKRKILGKLDQEENLKKAEKLNIFYINNYKILAGLAASIFLFIIAWSHYEDVKLKKVVPWENTFLFAISEKNNLPDLKKIYNYGN